MLVVKQLIIPTTTIFLKNFRHHGKIEFKGRVESRQQNTYTDTVLKHGQ